MTRTDAFVIVTPGFAANEADHNCLPALQAWVQRLQQQRPQLQVVVLALQYPYTAKDYTWFGCRVVALGGQGLPRLYRLRTWWKAWQMLKRLRQQYRLVGLLSFWLSETALVGKGFGRRYNIPHYCWLQGQDAKKDNRYVKRVRPTGSELVTISDFLSDTLQQQHNLRPVAVIPIGVTPWQQVMSGDLRDIDIIAAGSLIPLKRFEVLVHVAAQLAAHFPQLRVLLCGAGPLEPALKNLIAQLGIPHIVTLAGQVPHPQMLTLMERSKLFLHPSSYEGFGMVCLEALNAGTPVISFCQPMHAPVKNWHIVANEAAMYHKALQLLQDWGHDYTSVAPYALADSVEQMMALYGL
jgi:glycosyltransferase involved in cell wall biosynthesis